MKIIEFCKGLFRLLARPLAYNFYYSHLRKKYEVTRNGVELKPGITAVVAAKNEEYTLPLCLKSLLGVVDQIVCIDNGSEDTTLQKMYDFKKEHTDNVDVKIISMPGALLGDCREEGLKATNCQWHLRWDADMVCKTSGEGNMQLLRKKVLADSDACTYQLPRINLTGDLHHISIFDGPADEGEPILIRFSTKIVYKEYGKFDTIKVPFAYKQKREKKYYYFHCMGLKSDANLIYRFHYFDWRKACNLTSNKAEKEAIGDLNQFSVKRNLEWFGTNDTMSLKFRYQRQMVYHFAKYDIDLEEYPEVLKEEIINKTERFKAIYLNGKPYLRQDSNDEEMLNYQPTEEDLNWDPEDFLRQFLSAEQCRLVGIN